MEHNTARQLIDALYDDISPVRISATARQRLNIYDNYNFIYGDCNLTSLYNMLATIEPQPNTVFYDLGSGTGKALLFAASSFPFVKCVGVEFLPELTAIAEQKLLQLKTENSILTNNVMLTLPEIIFRQEDFTTTTLQDADLVFIHATCFDLVLLETLTKHLNQELKPRARVIIIARQLSSPNFKLLNHDIYPMDWGQSTVYFYEKI